MSENQLRTLRPAAAAAKIGVSPSTLWAWAKSDPEFPRPFKLGQNCTAFFEHEIDAFLNKRAACSRSER